MIVALAIALYATPAPAPVLPEAEQVVAILEDMRATTPSAALAAGVLHGDAVFRRTWGARDDATFRIASITKTFTALIALQLAKEGKLDLDVDVRSYVPQFPAKPWTITARHLLSHTSGLPHYRGRKDALTRTAYTTAQSLSIFANRPLSAPPGSEFIYTSFGYNLLGAALESASGKSFATLLDERILRPLDMRDTGLERAVRRARDIAGFRVEKGVLVQSDRIDISSRFSSGGMRSTADDLLRYARALLDHEIVDEDTWRAMTTPTLTSEGKQCDYGLGFAVYPSHGRAIVAHAGGQPETSSLLLLVPEERIAVVLLANVEGQSGELTRAAARIIDVLLGVDEPQRALYSDDVADELIYDGMRRIFSYGLGAPADGSDAELSRAFAALETMFVRENIEADPEAAKQAIADAYHPVSGRISPLVGGEMARVLAARGLTSSSLRARGALTFFEEYVDACRSSCTHPLPSSLVHEIKRISEAWRATPPALLKLRAEDVHDHLDDLAVLEGRSIHPSFRLDLERAALRLHAEGREEDAARARALALALHPVDHEAALKAARARAR